MSVFCGLQFLLPLICAVQVPLEGPSTYSATAEDILIPLEPKPPVQQDSGFVVYPPLPGDLYAGDFIGSEEKDILAVGGKDRNTTVSFADPAGRTCLQAEWGGGTISGHGRVVGWRSRDALLGLNEKHLVLMDVVGLDLRILLIDLPSSPLAVDVADLNGDDVADVVALTETGLYAGFFEDGGMRWVNLPSQESIYSAWLASLPVSDRLEKAMLWPLVVDLRGGGRADIILPGMRKIALYLNTGGSHLNLVEIPAPPDWPREETIYREQCVRRMLGHIPTVVRSFHTYDMVHSADGIQFVRFDEFGPAKAYRLDCSREMVELQPSETFSDQGRPIVFGDFVNTSRCWLPWAAATVRLLWPHTVSNARSKWFADANEWIIDINNDGIEDRVSVVTELTTSGPKTTVLYRIREAESGWGGEHWNSLSGPGWSRFKASSVADLNGDGCLDIIFMKPRAPLRAILSEHDKISSMECEYDAWVFDPAGRSFQRSREHGFVIDREFPILSASLAVNSRFGPYLWAWGFIDFGDLNGDGLTDIVLALSPNRLGVLYNNGPGDRAFLPDNVVAVELPGFGNYIVAKIGEEYCILVWDEDGPTTIILPDRRGSTE